MFDRIAAGGFLNHNRSAATSHTLPRSTVVALAFAAVLAACGGGGDSGGGAAYIPPVAAPQVPGSVTGQVQSASDGQAIAGATVTVAGTTVTTGADGLLSFPDLTQADRLPVTISAPGYVDTVRFTAVSNNAATRVPMQLAPVAATVSVDAAAGGTVPVPGSQAQVVFPAGAIVAADGSAPTQPVIVQITPIATGQDANLLTGDYRTGATTFFETFGGLTVTLTDANGGSYRLATGQSATIRIPGSTRREFSTLPAAPTLYRFDAVTGYWVASGTVTQSGTMANFYYEASITQPGPWAAGVALDTVMVTGCAATPNGLPVRRARIEADGITYSGTSSALTDNAGRFSIPVRRSATAALVGRAGSRLSNARAVTTENASPHDMGGGCLVFADAAISIKLTWGRFPSDVDSHLLTPQNVHIDYTTKGSLTDMPYANLDIDDITSFGPEFVTIRRLARGTTYRYFLDNYSNDFVTGMGGVKVEVTYNGDTTIYTPGTGQGGLKYWHAFDVVVDAQCAVTITPVDVGSSSEPSNPNPSGTAISYCPTAD